MRALVLYCHPRPESFTAAVRDVILARLAKAEAEVRVLDLYARAFAPVMSARELANYEDDSLNTCGIETDVADIAWCDTLIFVYPTWWYGLPAILKGWLDRVLVPGKAFMLPDETHKNIRPGLTHISALGVFTTCGASWWLTCTIGAPGRRTLLRGVGLLCQRGARKVFVAHYSMDSSTPQSRAAHLDKVARKVDRLTGYEPQPQERLP